MKLQFIDFLVKWHRHSTLNAEMLGNVASVPRYPREVHCRESFLDGRAQGDCSSSGQLQ